MNKNLQMMMFVAVAMLFAGAITSYAQQPPMVGGYKSVRVDDAGVRAAADFAVNDYSQKNDDTVEGLSIQKAERQVVQGLNYRICMEVASDDGEVTQLIRVTVYQDLKKVYRLNSWRAVKSCSAK